MRVRNMLLRRELRLATAGATILPNAIRKLSAMLTAHLLEKDRRRS